MVNIEFLLLTSFKFNCLVPGFVFLHDIIWYLPNIFCTNLEVGELSLGEFCHDEVD